MKVKKLFGKVFKTKKSKIIVISVLAITAVGLAAFPFLYNGKSEVDTVYLGSLLEKSSELTTAKLTYTGLSEFKDEGTVFINRQDFIMVYSATARIGIDVKNVKIDADNNRKKIYVTIPETEIQEVKVDNKSIKYFDTKFALFNTDEKEDSNRAIALAEKEAEKEVGKMGVLEMADKQAEELIKGILANAVPDGYMIERKK